MSKILFLFGLLFLTQTCDNVTANKLNDIEGEWVLQKVFLSDAYDSPCGWEAGDHESITLNISSEGGKFSFNGNSAVNSYFGSFEVLSFDSESNNGTLKVGPIGSTKKAGSEPLMNCESRYFSYLETAGDIGLFEENELRIGNFKTPDSHPRDGGTYLIFERK
ncbi:META domain-containing protein [Jiulongibacter sediminis]|uniref:DUF306 domain-containing protein n=1 Tax=Jiulongibacter sediminis TaxID=1605367 RepID=A0A0P7BNJ3_9BACT|nr:META domain-containing protein [Jiulongibacter sediminis]KPM48800.1 hypothetical protein AFM12_09495 [Jiulongibacter sediminis]TBX25332.1 hypothetical protein TK44_09500 [Jiulongibacter sediminis]